MGVFYLCEVFIVMDKTIEKFMDSMGITYDITHGGKRFNVSTGNDYICVSVKAYYEGKTELELHYCYAKTDSGRIVFDEGNIVKEPGQGIFAYLGMNREIYIYFGDKAKKIAEYFLGDDEY